MGMVARCSVENEEKLYKLFGVNAELIIDHAWGWEPCTIGHIKAYRPENNSFSNSQVLQSPYPAAKARIVAQEMADNLALHLVERKFTASQLGLYVNYDVENLEYRDIQKMKIDVVSDYYGRLAPKPAHGTVKLQFPTASSAIITNTILNLFDSIVKSNLLIRRITIDAYNILPESLEDDNQTISQQPVQLDIFTDYDKYEKQKEQHSKTLKKERKMQEAVIGIKHKFGKNAILKGLNFEEGATAKERNRQIGGHKA